MGDILRKVYRGQIRSINRDDFTVEAIVSYETIDRYNEMILSDAWEKGLSAFRAHPVLLSSHDYYSLTGQIGEVEKISVKDKALMAKLKYYVGEGNEQADWGFKLAEKGIAAFSVGFIPKAETCDEDEIAKLVPGKHKPRRVFKEVELLEVSHVVVPANPSALQKSVDMEEDPVLREVAMEVLEAYKKDESFKAEMEERDYEKRAVVPYKSYPPMDRGKAWDGDAAKKRIAKWASSDGSGEKDTIDWGEYRKAFAQYDSEKEDNFGSYKFPHHDVEDGELKTHWRGCVACLVRLKNSDIPEEDKKGVYNHIAKHYRNEFDEEPPEYRDYSSIEDVISGCKDVATASFMLKEIYELRQIALLRNAIGEASALESFKEMVVSLKGELKEEVKSLIVDTINNSIKSLIPDVVDGVAFALSAIKDSEESIDKASKEEKYKTYVSEILALTDHLRKSSA